VLQSGGKVQDDVDWRIHVFTRFSEHKESLAIFRRHIVISGVAQMSDRCRIYITLTATDISFLSGGDVEDLFPVAVPD
jgi:hypothetical protein